jgi:ribosomal protein S27AE
MTVESSDATDTAYMNCPRCGLSIRLHPRMLTVRHCPRCVAVQRRLVELVSSPLPTEKPYTGDR